LPIEIYQRVLIQRLVIRPWDNLQRFGYDELDLIAPSPIAFGTNWKTPKEMTKEDIKNVVEKFVKATQRALKAGFDVIEIHAAHGYLLNEFLSLLQTNEQMNTVVLLKTVSGF